VSSGRQNRWTSANHSKQRTFGGFITPISHKQQFDDGFLVAFKNPYGLERNTDAESNEARRSADLRHKASDSEYFA